MLLLLSLSWNALAYDYVINILDYSIQISNHVVLLFLGYVSNILLNVLLDWYKLFKYLK